MFHEAKALELRLQPNKDIFKDFNQHVPPGKFWNPLRSLEVDQKGNVLSVSDKVANKTEPNLDRKTSKASRQ